MEEDKCNVSRYIVIDTQLARDGQPSVQFVDSLDAVRLSDLDLSNPELILRFARADPDVSYLSLIPSSSLLKLSQYELSHTTLMCVLCIPLGEANSLIKNDTTKPLLEKVSAAIKQAREKEAEIVKKRQEAADRRAKAAQAKQVEKAKAVLEKAGIKVEEGEKVNAAE